MAYDTDRRMTGQMGPGTWTQAEAAEIDAGLRAYMLRVYNYMASGLLLSGVVALTVAGNESISSLFYQSTQRGYTYTGLGWITVLAPIGLLFAMNGRRSAGALQGMYWTFVALMGVGLASAMMIYTGVSVARTFFITAGSFGALSLFGYTTKKDLSGFGSFLFMGLIGIVIAGVVNIFLGSAMVHFVISSLGVLIFAGLTAFDTQRIKNSYFEVGGSDVEEHSAIMGAVSLYLNFINLFQFLLSFLGNRE
ncbi:MAG: Bax inhibitor-1/YccA family protein [Alphaproteobacteria bacterium]|nr:Bax inhibitor-1/YccA family protein [Alphaproteobacteria bacterium]